MPPLMPAAKLQPGAAEHHHAAAGHVLAAVVAHALDHRQRAGVAHGEALAGEPAEERAARGGAVEHRVADDHVLLGGEGGRRAAGAPRSCRRRGPCPRSRWRRPPASSSRRARARRRSSGRPSPGARSRSLPVGQARRRRGAARSRRRAARRRRGSCSRSAARARTGVPVLDGRPAALQQVDVDRVVEHRLGRADAAARRVRSSLLGDVQQRGAGRSRAPSSGPRPSSASSRSVRPISSSTRAHAQRRPSAGAPPRRP